MVGALWTGISGLGGSQQGLDNESNNIANVNTIGFKSSRVSFADQMYQDKIGKGVTSFDVEKLYTQGNLKNTGVSYDMALSGDGFFQVKDGNAKFLIGKILPMNFTNVSGLNPEGDNLYTQGVDQKDPFYIEGAATVEGKYLEKSNIDLSETLVNLMVWQKAFDANSKTVTTSDELLKTALALKTS